MAKNGTLSYLGATGSLPVRAGHQCAAGRNRGKGHQNVLVCYKGDPRHIRITLGPAEVLLEHNVVR